MSGIINAFLVLAALVIMAGEARAGHFFSDFNHGVPPHCRVFGSASIESYGGYNNTGMLQLTEPQNSSVGTMILDPLDGKMPTASFIITYKAFIGGGTGADGFGLHFGDLPMDRMGENGLANDFTVTFDTFKNGRTEIAPGIRVMWRKKVLAQVSVPKLRAERFVDVLIKWIPTERSMSVMTAVSFLAICLLGPQTWRVISVSEDVSACGRIIT